MPAQDVGAKTKVEIQEAAMSVLIEALGGDDDSNITWPGGAVLITASHRSLLLSQQFPCTAIYYFIAIPNIRNSAFY